MAHTIGTHCLGCAACLAHCPLDAIRPAEPVFVIVPELCTDCGVCVDVCPKSAIQSR